MQRMNKNEAHVSDYPAGHRMTVDCWCEPTKIWWATDNNKKVLVIEHRDDVPAHHKVILKQRNDNQDWITQTLNTIYRNCYTKLL